jgi:hypothetical protein
MPLAECCALMGTMVHAGSGTAWWPPPEDGGVRADRLGQHQPETRFPVGLRNFFMIPGAAA